VPNLKKPLPDSVRQEINTRLRELSDLLPILDTYEKCGVDCADFRRQISEYQEQFETIKSELFPGKP
jgi:hypothetical protein